MSTRVGPPPPPGVQRIPPLQPGDHLTRDEFERRYDATPGVKQAELIEGVVFMPPPVSVDSHGAPHADLVGWLVTYRSRTPGVGVADNSTLRLDLENAPQPDAVLYIRPKYGGAAAINQGYLEGAPEFVAEVSASSVSIDMNTKFRVYRRNGVREYLVWRVEDRAVDWFALQSGDYVRLPADSEGVIRSQIFPGLWLATRALLNEDIDGVLRCLHLGLATAEHAKFVADLGSKAGRP